IGVFLFDFFSACFQQGARAITGNRALVQSLSFPRISLPLAVVVEQFYTLLLSLIVMFGILIVLGHLPDWRWLLMVPLVGLYTLFNAGVAMFTARLTVHFRDLTQILPRIHIVVASIEKITPTLNDVSEILRVLARSATGQDMSVYTTFSTGPRRPGDPDGPEEYHVVLLDNGRTAMLGSGFQDALRCIRCGACMNHCPVYHAIGGHAYGWVYPGPIGAVLTPTLVGVDEAGDLPNASTFCGRCEAVCPMRIPLPKMMRYWRDREFERHLSPTTIRWGIGFWAFFARHPWLYRLGTRFAARALANRAIDRGRFKSLPLAGGWTKHRDFPAPEGQTFMEQWAKRKKAA
ncbi:MAG: LUD domain-containing protein, partial [Rhizobiales bacterium]|nr:LUD domain-containing protein [Hyphomicrobiales bacterium]